MKMLKTTTFILYLSLLLALIWFRPATAQATTPTGPSDDQVNAIAKQLYCPVCENIPLDVCGTQACAQWRNLIHLRLSEGWTEGQIKQYFVDQYGIRVLATPPVHGINWLIYVVPPMVMLVGVLILFRVFRSWQPSVHKFEESENLPAQKNDYIKRIEEELKKH
jgi:cytochrome c-type biogenesis protein CcmH